MKIKLIPLLLLATLGTPAWGQSCGCGDVRDLRNRVCEARAAMAEYQKQIQRIQRYEKDTLKDHKLMYTKELYKERMQPCVQEALNSATDVSARRGTAGTNNACEIVFQAQPPTQCLRDSLTRHESVHQTVCMEARLMREQEGLASEFRSLFQDTRSGKSLVDIALEEYVAYRTEMDFGLEQLTRLSKSCSRDIFEVEVRPGRREFTIDYCPPARPRPKPEESSCPQPGK